MANVWLTEYEACRIVNRSPYTLRDQRIRGDIKARKRRGTWEYEHRSLLMHQNRLASKEQNRPAHHWHREEAIWTIRECVQQKLPIPTDAGLAAWFDVTYSQAQAWKRQFLAQGAAGNMERTDQELADRMSTTVGNIRTARKEYQARQNARQRNHFTIKKIYL